MQRFKPKVPWRPTRVPPIDRMFQYLLGIIILGVVYRYCWIDIADPYKCSALLNTGGWLDDGPRWTSRTPFQNWQPNGCIMHEYKKADIRECLVNRRLVFIGDSTTRQVFWAVATKLDPHKAEDEAAEMVDMDKKHNDIEFSSGGVTVQFKWDPWLNSTELAHELDIFRARSEDGDREDGSAAIILLGAPGLWYARHGQENFFKDFRDSIDRVIPYMDHTSENNAGSSSPVPFGRRSPNFLLLAPVQVPWYQALTPALEATITPEKIDQMNDLLQQVSAHSRADVVWSYTLMTWAGRAAYQESGLHVIDNIAHRKADVLLNLRCNAQSAAKGYPYNRTCCNNYTPPTAAQWTILLTGMLLLPATFFLRRRQFRKVARLLPSTEVLGALMTMGLVVCFCFYADRTQIFEKSHKQFRKREFMLALQVTSVVGLLSIRKTKISKSKSSSLIQESGVLSRDQTDEWKGWMQVFILVYHYTNGAKTLWIYELVRLIIASYLFMTGFEHTKYFLERGDYSFKRVASVLIRLNLLSCILPYMMKTEYIFYYFAPLASFWFIVVYLTLRISYERNSDIFFLARKVLISAGLTTAFTTIPGVLEVVFTVLRFTCAISWNIYEWRFRIYLDMYIVYIGMLLAILTHRISQLKSRTITPHGKLDALLMRISSRPTALRVLTTLLSLILIPSFFHLIRRSPNNADYNWWNPFISCVPILSFLALRNSVPILRMYHSTLFIWLGRISLETYILQYHIWLAGDTTGLLRLGLWNHWFESALLTGVFLWVSWKTARATLVLTWWIVGWKEGSRLGLGRIGMGGKEDRLVLVKERDDGLLRLEDGEGTPSKGERFAAGFGLEDGKAARLGARVVGFVSGDLRVRVGLMILVLWLGNVWYR